MNRLLVIFSGYNQRAVIAFLRCLNKNGIKDFAIVSSSKSDTIHLTSYTGNVFAVRQHRILDKDEIIQILKNIKKAYSVINLVIVPSTEALNRFLLKYRNEFEEIGCTIPLVNQELYEAISDKHSFWKICKNKNLTIPKLLSNGSSFSRPFVAKPKKYFSDSGIVYSPIIIKTEQMYQKFISNYNVDEFDLQEYVNGESYYLLYYFSKNGSIVKYSQKNLAQQPNGKSILAAEGALIHNFWISEEYEELFKNLKYRGFVMLELRKQDESFYMIEANPRLWGPSQFIVDADIPIFEAFLFDYGFLETYMFSAINQNARYLWSTGARCNLLYDDSCVWYSNGNDVLKNNWNAFYKFDVYNRKDTIKIYYRELNERM